jgi:hypothetical protein
VGSIGRITCPAHIIQVRDSPASKASQDRQRRAEVFIAAASVPSPCGHTSLTYSPSLSTHATHTCHTYRCDPPTQVPAHCTKIHPCKTYLNLDLNLNPHHNSAELQSLKHKARSSHRSSPTKLPTQVRTRCAIIHHACAIRQCNTAVEHTNASAG